MVAHIPVLATGVVVAISLSTASSFQISSSFTPAGLHRTVVSQSCSNKRVSTPIRTTPHALLDGEVNSASTSRSTSTQLHASNFFSVFQNKPKATANKRIVLVTGTSSGLGKGCATALVNDPTNFVICAVRDVEKMKGVAQEGGWTSDQYTILPLELASLSSVRQFAATLKSYLKGRPLDGLVCNAAVYQPALDVPQWTEDGFEQQLGINHLGHFLLTSLLLDDLKKAKDPRCVIVGSITGNSNTIGGGLVWPRADLGKLQGLEKGGKKPVSMVDGQPFNGAKAYKDSKVLNMMTVNELHRRYHDSTGITFSSMYPGCIAETALFREKREWFRKLFPLFMKYVTGGYVGELEAGERLAQCVTDPRTKKSGVYWSWNGNAKQVGVIKDGVVVGAGGSGGDIFENEQSDLVRNPKLAEKMWDLSTDIVGAKWPSTATAGASAPKGRALQAV